ncbi:ATP-binding protein [Piscirickettsia litoralis]|uniref:histidine kinase n=1 Tax=Piscirickettsia litoralis TaxID=1891921 RepID=A0ABX3A034_9GAMM|nr:ATP-binding protein [Piscirickettsia litoralis]ODN42226.1 histidine kinase [Piscirickettsia litoralis]
MKEWGIKTRVTLLTLVPTLTISILLGSYFISIRLQSLEQTLQQRGNAYISQLLLDTQARLLTHHGSLKEVTDAAVTYSDVEGASVFDTNGRLLAHTGKSINLDDMELFSPSALSHPEQRTMTSGTNLVFLVPITPSHASASYDNAKPIGWLALQMTRIPTILNQYQTFFVTLFIICIGLTISALFGLRLGKDVTDPILQLVDAIKKLKEGQLDTRVHTGAGGELQSLEAGINSMAVSLNRSHEELQQSIEQATADLRETLETIEVQNIELDIARKQALEASRVKSEFLANMSHELRTPLNGIIGFANLLLKAKLTTRQADYASTIHRSAERLLRIINDILDFSKIEAGKMLLEPQMITSRDCFEEALMLLAPSAHEKRLELAFIMYSDVPNRIIADPLRLNQVATNLIANAIKFTLKGRIVVRLSLEDEQDDNIILRFEIEDTGIGLSKLQQRNLFQAFTQADASTTRKYGGTGLGLAICKRLAEQMGGNIGVESEEGAGAKFWFTFKAKRVKEEQNQLTLFTHKQALLYEPYEATQASLRHLLQLWGFHVICTEHLQRLTALAQENQPDIILIGTNTIEESEKLQKETLPKISASCHSPIVLLANCSEEMLYNSQKPAEASALIAKPVRHLYLLQQITALLDKDQPATINEQNNPLLLPTPSEHNNIHVLAVDDNSANLKLVVALLEQIGVYVSTATNGIEAIELFEKQHFDLVLMDVQMPIMDGIQACKEIRKIEKALGQHTPVVALSADATGHKEIIQEAGLDDYQTKPINENQLRSLISRWTNTEIKTPSKAMTPSYSTTEHNWPMLEHIDINEGIKLTSGSEALFFELLELLVKRLPEDLDAITTAFNTKAFDELRHRVHKLHGASCYCGTPRLKEISAELEKQLKQTQNNHKLEPYTTELLASIRGVLSDAEQLAKSNPRHFSSKAS